MKTRRNHLQSSIYIVHIPNTIWHRKIYAACIIASVNNFRAYLSNTKPWYRIRIMFICFDVGLRMTQPISYSKLNRNHLYTFSKHHAALQCEFRFDKCNCFGHISMSVWETIKSKTFKYKYIEKMTSIHICSTKAVQPQLCGCSQLNYFGYNCMHSSQQTPWTKLQRYMYIIYFDDTMNFRI